MKAADKVSRNLLDRPLSKKQKKKVGPIVHYAFGTAMGAVYGVAAELFPEIAPRGFGTGFGAALFAIADELAVPAFGLSGKPTEAPFSSHVYGLASHLVYGLRLRASVALQWLLSGAHNLRRLPAQDQTGGDALIYVGCI
jgi:uncharacterized membrane protein YagU involved in acid resistance